MELLISYIRKTNYEIKDLSAMLAEAKPVKHEIDDAIK